MINIENYEIQWSREYIAGRGGDNYTKTFSFPLTFSSILRCYIVDGGPGSYEEYEGCISGDYVDTATWNVTLGYRELTNINCLALGI